MPEGLGQLEHLVKSTKDWDAIYRQAHFLKSSVSVIRIRNMFDNLTKMEAAAKAQDKDTLLSILEDLLTTYGEAHTILVARCDATGAGKI
jgi:hypothetical protein